MPDAKTKVDIIFASPDWGKSGLGCRKLIPTLIDITWGCVPNRPKNFIPDICVTLTDDPSIRTLNHQHRNKDTPTNVLSFQTWDSLTDIPSNISSAPVGDIFIAFETIKREALQQQKPPKHHFSHMIIHGFLHLLGYDHIKDSDAEKMEALEVKILKKMDIPNPYI